MHMTSDDPSHLPVRAEHLAEHPTLTRGQTDGVPRRDAGQDRLVVHRDQRGQILSPRQLCREPAESLTVKRAMVFTWAR